MIFVASTGQNVGKTTTSLGLLSGLQKRFSSVGFIKPVGQEHIRTECGHYVDKDVALFQNQFGLDDPVEQMSPVLFPKGFTRDFLDGQIEEDLSQKVVDSFDAIASAHDVVLVEGTGHAGVGSLVGLNNAQVAKLLGLDMIFILSGGLGSSFDAFAVNKALCDQEGVRVAGVILNRVYPEKRDMVLEYVEKALERWQIPILGCIPYDEFLSKPCMRDFASLFKTKLLTGREHLMRHFETTRLVATSLDVYKNLIVPSQLLITPASREDIIRATLAKQWEGEDLKSGMILTGSLAPRPELINLIEKADIPMLYAPGDSYSIMQKISKTTVKIRKEDTEKVEEAIQVVESHLDFEKICKLLSHSSKASMRVDGDKPFIQAPVSQVRNLGQRLAKETP